MRTWLYSRTALWVITGAAVLGAIALGFVAIEWVFWSVGHPRQYDFACSQGAGGTAPSLIKSIPELLPGYHYDDFLDSCTDGSGFTLIFVSKTS